MKKDKRIPIACVIIGLVLAIVVAMAEGDGKEDITALKRPEVGASEKEYQLNVIYDGTESVIEVLLDERELSFEEAQEIFDRGYEELIKILEEENGSLDTVTKDLYLPDSILKESLAVTWRSGNRQFILDDGTLNREACKGITEAGQVVIMIAEMSLQDYAADVEIPVCISTEVFSFEEKQENIILDGIKQAEANSQTEESVELPQQIEGKQAEYYQLKEKTWWQYLALGVLVAAGYVLLQRQKTLNEEKSREKELQLAYAPIITKFTLLTGAGITIKGAWEKLVSDYKKEAKPNAAYEEMLKVYNEMQNGLSEGDAYVLFGKRCKLSSYVKFGNLLEQNLRKGTKGLTERLEYEVWEAFEERKALAYRLGEEAGTKLLIPMMLSLGIVIAFCVVPAFLNM